MLARYRGAGNVTPAEIDRQSLRHAEVLAIGPLGNITLRYIRLNGATTPLCLELIQSLKGLQTRVKPRGLTGLCLAIFVLRLS